MTVLQILEPRFDKLILKGFQNGWFNASRDKLFAYAVLSVKDEDYEDLYSWYLQKNATSYYPKEKKQYHNYNDDGSFSLKGNEQLVAENIIKHVALWFYGIDYQGEWFVMFSCSFHEENDKQEISNCIEEQFEGQFGFQTGVFETIPEYREEIDFGALRKIVSEELGREVGLRDVDLLFSHTANWPREKMPRKKCSLLSSGSLKGSHGL